MFALIPRSLTSNYGAKSFASNLVKNRALLSALDLANTTAASQKRPFHQVTGDIICPSQVMGIDHLRDPRLNKGLAFTLEERQALGIHGLQPARFKTQEQQLELCRISIMRYQEDLNKYLYLNELHDRNEKLFFRLLAENVEMLMPIVYTPTVGLACQKFGLIYRRPRGLFVTINDKGHCFDVLRNWPEHDVKAIVVTDGERILGLGDLGACGMGIPVGKLALYTALAGIKPHQCLPITLDVGTNNETLLDDPLYVGLRQKRATGTEYDDFVDEFMQAIVKRYGQDTLIQFEDFGNHNAFRFLEKYRTQYCTFNDDIQGTASVIVAGLMASKRITNKPLSEHTFCFLGAGGAACGIANLIVKQMQMEGLPVVEARNRIWMLDIDGLLTKSRPEKITDTNHHYYIKDHKPEKDLFKIVSEIKPSVLIGAAAAAGAFTPKILQKMAENHERPIIFALSNPTSKAECTAQEAYEHTQGRAIFASGSPFPKCIVHGKEFTPGQGNNAYVFPGVALGVICSRIHHIREELFLIAAQVVADNVSQSDLDMGRLYPPLSIIRECSVQIATKIAAYAYEQGIATVYPEPRDKRAHVEAQTYNFNYDVSLPSTYAWKKIPQIATRPLTHAEVATVKK